MIVNVEILCTLTRRHLILVLTFYVFVAACVSLFYRNSQFEFYFSLVP